MTFYYTLAGYTNTIPLPQEAPVQAKARAGGTDAHATAHTGMPCGDDVKEAEARAKQNCDSEATRAKRERKKERLRKERKRECTVKEAVVRACNVAVLRALAKQNRDSEAKRERKKERLRKERKRERTVKEAVVRACNVAVLRARQATRPPQAERKRERNAL